MIVVLDVGSSSLRSSLWERDGSSLGEKARIEQAGTGELEADPLLGRVARVLDRAAADGREVTAVATSTFWHCLLGLDDRGRPITPVYSWADARSAPHAAELRERLDEQAIHARTGCRLHSSYWPAKLAWLRDTQPETFERVAVWVSPGEYVHRRLLGDAAASVSMASGTGLFDQHACEWDRELAADLGVEDKLPAIDDSPREGLTGDWAERWPALRGRPVVPGLGRRRDLQRRRRLRDEGPRRADDRHQRRPARARPRRAARAAALAVVLPRRRGAAAARRQPLGRRQRRRLAAAASPSCRSRRRPSARSRRWRPTATG